MTDDFDTTTWLPRGEPCVTQHRLAKGDVVYNEGRYFEESPLTIDWLYNQQIIETHQHSAALNFINLYTLAFSFMHANKTTSASSNPEFCPLTVYTRVSRMMLPYQLHLVQRLCFEPVRMNDRAWIRHVHVSIEKSFEALAKALDEAMQDAVKLDSQNDYACPKFDPLSA